MSKMCYVCGRTEEQFDAYFQASTDENIDFDKDVMGEGREIYERTQKNMKVVPQSLDNLHGRDRLLYNLYESELYRQQLSELNGKIALLGSDPADERIQDCFEVNEGFRRIYRRITPAFRERYRDWTHEKYSSALDCGYPFGNGDRELIEEILRTKASVEEFLNIPNDAIRYLQREKAELESKSEAIVNLTVPDRFRKYMLTGTQVTFFLCPVCDQMLNFDPNRPYNISVADKEIEENTERRFRSPGGIF